MICNCEVSEYNEFPKKYDIISDVNDKIVLYQIWMQ